MNASIKRETTVALGWQLESARLIAFPTESPLFLDQHWWLDLTSGQAEGLTSAQKKNLREERVNFDGVSLSLRIGPTWVEWSIQPIGDLEGQSAAYPVIGPYWEKVNWFVELLTPWLANLRTPLLRLAFTGKLLQAAATQEEAYQVLSTHLRTLHLGSNPNDLLFQVNRRRISTVVPDLPINRVSTWSKRNLTISGSYATPFSWPDNCYSALELDMNTAPERPIPLPQQSLSPLFRELATFGVEIAQYGDIP